MRMKAKTSPTGYIATLTVDDDVIEFPVSKFDDQGFALICDPRGRLTRAVDSPGFVDIFPLGQVSR